MEPGADHVVGANLPTEELRKAAEDLVALFDKECGAKHGVTALYWALVGVMLQHKKDGAMASAKEIEVGDEPRLEEPH